MKKDTEIESTDLIEVTKNSKYTRGSLMKALKGIKNKRNEIRKKEKKVEEFLQESKSISGFQYCSIKFMWTSE